MRETTTTYLILVAILFSLCGSARAGKKKKLALHHLKRNPFPNSREIYKKIGSTKLEARIYTPKDHSSDDSRPAALVIHGGGWTSPGTKYTALHSRYLARRGMVAINIEYRLADRTTDVRIDNIVTDCRDALRYMVVEADRLGIDPEQIVVMGESAGGHLAAMLALTSTAETDGKKCPAAAVLYNPCLDLTALPWLKNHPGVAPRSDTPDDQSWKERARPLSPSEHLSEEIPPMLLIHGTDDGVVPIKQVDRFVRQAKKSGAVQYHRQKDWGHAFALPEIGTEQQILTTLTLTDKFLASQNFITGKCPIGDPFEPQEYRKTLTDKERKEPHVVADSHSLERWPYIDGQWLGITDTDNGYVYFAVSSHDRLQHAQLFRYSMKKDEVEHLTDVGKACGEVQLNSPTQDKIHSQMFEHGDVVYCGTCDGHASYTTPYQGGYWLAIDKKSGEVTNLGRTITRDGLLCVGHDPRRNLLYGLGNHRGLLTVFDPETRSERVLGFPWKGSDANWPRGLTMMITKDGRVYGFRHPHGTVWEYDPSTGKIRILDIDMPLPEELKGDDVSDKLRKQWEHSGGHLTRWNEQDQCFYFLRSFDETLCRFYPPKDGEKARFEVVHSLHPDIPRLWGNRPASCVLRIHDRTVWYTPCTGWGGVTHLVSYNLDTKQFRHYGPITVEKGRRVNECHSMEVGPNGKLYLVAFIYSIKGEDPVRRNAIRGAYPFHPRLVVIDPDTDLKPRTEK